MSEAAVLVGEGAGAVAPAALPAVLAQRTRPPRWLWLDATQGLTLLAEPGARFADGAALAAWARRLWATYGHDGAAAVAPWRSGAGHAATLTAADIGGWRAAASAAGARIAGVAPVWAGALALALRQLPALARRGRVLVAEGAALTVIDITDGEIRHWQLVWLERADAALLTPWADGAPGGLALALGHGLPGVPPGKLRVPQAMGGDAAAFIATLPRVVAPAFLPTTPLPPRWAWALVATAALVALVAGIEAMQAWQGRAAAQAELAQQRTEPSRPGRAGAGPARADRAVDTHLADAARLAQPWAARFAVAESAVPAGGSWLRLEQPRGEAPLRLAGLAASPDEAYALAQRLLAAPGVADVAVLRSEAQGGSGARFELGVTLDAGAPR
jgi:hypothetical protein